MNLEHQKNCDFNSYNLGLEKRIKFLTELLANQFLF